MGLATKVLSLSRSKRKQNEQKCRKMNSGMFLLLNQGRNQANKTFTTNLWNRLSASLRFLIYCAPVLVILLLLFLHKTAEKIIFSMWIFKLSSFTLLILLLLPKLYSSFLWGADFGDRLVWLCCSLFCAINTPAFPGLFVLIFLWAVLKKVKMLLFEVFQSYSWQGMGFVPASICCLEAFPVGRPDPGAPSLQRGAERHLRTETSATCAWPAVPLVPSEECLE